MGSVGRGVHWVRMIGFQECMHCDKVSGAAKGVYSVLYMWHRAPSCNMLLPAPPHQRRKQHTMHSRCCCGALGMRIASMNSQCAQCTTMHHNARSNSEVVYCRSMSLLWCIVAG